MVWSFFIIGYFWIFLNYLLICFRFYVDIILLFFCLFFGKYGCDCFFFIWLLRVFKYSMLVIKFFLEFLDYLRIKKDCNKVFVVNIFYNYWESWMKIVIICCCCYKYNRFYFVVKVSLSYSFRENMVNKGVEFEFKGVLEDFVVVRGKSLGFLKL